MPQFMFGDLLRGFRSRARLTQQELADSLGVHHRTVQNWEINYRPVSRDSILSLEAALSLSHREADQLLFAAEYPLEYGTQPGELYITSSQPLQSSAPPLPPLVIGREQDVEDLKRRFAVRPAGQEAAPLRVLTAVRGWPGVGKTTIASVLAHDPDIGSWYPDGVLWVSLGQEPNLSSQLAAWGRALGHDDLLQMTLEEASARLTGVLRDKRVLLIIDDVWAHEDAKPFFVGGSNCAVLCTTRNSDVAQALAPNDEAIYRLSVLSEQAALELLRQLAPNVVAQYPDECVDLVDALEHLPLALQVAGRLLNTEAQYNFGVIDLLTALQQESSTILLEADVPADLVDLANQTTPTIAALMRKSTDRLDEEARDCFARLGPMAPKPASFDLRAMAALWMVRDARPIARRLLDRGLLEPVDQRFQMHALLVLHAKSLLTDE